MSLQKKMGPSNVTTAHEKLNLAQIYASIADKDDKAVECLYKEIRLNILKQTRGCYNCNWRFECQTGSMQNRKLCIKPWIEYSQRQRNRNQT